VIGARQNGFAPESCGGIHDFLVWRGNHNAARHFGALRSLKDPLNHGFACEFDQWLARAPRACHARRDNRDDVHG
jgi:hypothetical protein